MLTPVHLPVHSKIEAEVHEESERQRSREQRSRDARRACARCGHPFRLLFNKRLVCQLCAASVCRRCATYETGRRGWLCSVCQRERWVRPSVELGVRGGVGEEICVLFDTQHRFGSCWGWDTLT